MKKIVLSLFNGMNCIGCALDRIGIDAIIYGSEIDKFATQVSDALFPDTVNLGDVRSVIPAMELELLSGNIDTIDIIAAGSPCQGFSFAGKQLNFEDERSILFFEFIKILEWCRVKVNPNVKFLLENVSMKKEHQDIITRLVGIEPIVINSNLVSAQNRKRLYWTNIGATSANLFGVLEPGIRQPKDLGITLQDILQSNVDKKYYLSLKGIDFITKPMRLAKKYTAINGKKSLTLTANGQKNWTGTFISDRKGNVKNNQNKASCLTVGGNGNGNHSDMDVIVFIQQKARGFNKGGEHSEKAPTLTSNSWQQNNHLHFADTIRRLTPRECGRLQTFTEEELDVILNCGVSDSQLYKMFGNGWTVSVISWILTHLLWTTERK